MSIREELLAIIREEWNTERELFLEFINPPYEFIFKGLLHPVPAFHDPAVKENFGALRDFRALEEVQNALRSVRQIGQIHQALKKDFPETYLAWKKERAKGNSAITLFSVLGTLFAWFVKNHEAKPAFPSADLAEFMESAFEKRGNRRFLKPEWKENFTAALGGNLETAPLLALVFDEIEDDFSRVDLNVLDPRFISSICLTIQIVKAAKKGKSDDRPKKKNRSRA